MTEFVSPHTIELFESPLGGDGVRALVPLAKGCKVFHEKPLIALQTVSTTKDVIVCANCMSFIGGADLQMEYLARKVSRVSLSEGDQPREGVFPCAHHCGEIYCSSACLNEHWRSGGHQLLCTGLVKDTEAGTHPLMKFKVHACTTNEIFLLVAQVFAKICSSVSLSLSSGGDKTAAVDAATRPYRNYVRELWWDAAMPPRDSNPETFRELLQLLVQESYELLYDVLDLRGYGLDTILDVEYFARTIGMFEQNNVGIRLSNPAFDRIEAVVEVASTTYEEAAILLQTVEEIADNIEEADCCSQEDEVEVEGADEDEDEEVEEEEDGENYEGNEDMGPCLRLKMMIGEYGADKLFPPLDGTAFYSTICKINHSCCPNVFVKYNCFPDIGLVAELYVLRDVAEGEELTQSYIDQSLDFESRTTLLKEYGFDCTCLKCTEDRSTR